MRPANSARPRFEEAQGRRVGVAARVDGQLIVVERVVAGRVLGKGAGRAVLEALVDRQDHQLARACERAGLEHPAQVLEYAGGLGSVPAENLFDTIGHLAHLRRFWMSYSTWLSRSGCGGPRARGAETAARGRVSISQVRAGSRRGSGHKGPAVGVDHLPGDVARGVGRQEEQRVRDVLTRARGA